LAARHELSSLLLKDEGQNPTGSFKARGLSMAVSKAKELGVDGCIIPTAGNAGVALAAYVWGYRIALLVSGAGAIRLASEIGWGGSLAAMAVLAGAGALVTAGAVEPAGAPAPNAAASFGQRLRIAVVDPFRDFLRRPAALQIIAFVMLFKLGEALAHTMATPFYRAMGFDRNQVAYATGIPGLLAKVMLENFAEAMADAAFLTYLSALCSTAFTATQYALLSSLAAVGLRTVGGFSGVLAGALGWTGFYALTILAAVPAMLIMLGLLRRFPPPLRPGPSRPAAIP